MQKGFTLVELLGVIVLLGVIILVAVPSLIQSNKNAQTSATEDFNNNITAACEAYVEVHSDRYQNLLNVNGTSLQIEVSDLVYEGYLKTDLQNPTTKKSVFDEGEAGVKIIATNTNGKVTYKYGG